MSSEVDALLSKDTTVLSCTSKGISLTIDPLVYIYSLFRKIGPVINVSKMTLGNYRAGYFRKTF